MTADAAGGSAAQVRASRSSFGFFDLLRSPDSVLAQVEADGQGRPDSIKLVRAGSSWRAGGVDVQMLRAADSVRVGVRAPGVPLMRLHLRWTTKTAEDALYLGDAWERSYGDLAWRTMVPERVLPWYFAAHGGGTTHAYGVRTGAGAFCFWQVDAEGVSLWMDVSNGGGGVALGERELAAATIVTREGRPGEQPMASMKAFCGMLSPEPRLSATPVYGCNDWYYAYGHNTAEGILRDTELIASLSPVGGPRPFSVIDMGWDDKAKFPDMARLAEQIRSRNARPGIWIRPLEAAKGTSPTLLIPPSRRAGQGSLQSGTAYDPTVPESLEVVLARFTEVVGWKYELVKHDFSTYDLFGQWGSTMGGSPARPGWHFHDRARTNAEIVRDLYRSMRGAAGEKTLVLGCNTIGHLSAGLFEMQRTGDDTSGHDWERTRRMGVNTLAYRLPQHRTFFDVDADCVGITESVPWKLNQQWLDVIARSGTSLFVSPGPGSIGPEQKAAMKEAFAIAASGRSSGGPSDWLESTTPRMWRFGGEDRRYEWVGPDGADPFST